MKRARFLSLHDLERGLGSLAREIVGADEREQERRGEAIRVHLVAQGQRFGGLRERGELLGRRVEHRSGDEVRVELGGDAEVEEDRVQAPGEGCEKDVLGFDVLVAQAGFVEGVERAGDGQEHFVGFVERERAALQPFGERDAFVDGHGEPDVALGHAVIFELDDVRMACGGEHHELALDVAARIDLVGHDLQRDLVGRNIDPFGDVHFPEHPFAEQAHEPVVVADEVADVGQEVGAIGARTGSAGGCRVDDGGRESLGRGGSKVRSGAHADSVTYISPCQPTRGIRRALAVGAHSSAG